MRRHVTRFLLPMLLLCCLWGLLSETTRSEGPQDRFVDWYGLGRCTEPVLLIPTDVENVLPFIPQAYWGNIATVPSVNEAQTSLVITLNKCPINRLVTTTGEYFADDVVEVIIGVLMKPTVADGPFQFYALASFVNWSPLASAYKNIGLPTVYVKDIRYEVDIDPLTGIGVYSVEVPWTPEQFSAEGWFIRDNPVEIDGGAAHFHEGPHGLVKVTHTTTFATDISQGTVTADNPDSLLAQVMGAASRDAVGVFIDKDEHRHVHSARIVDPAND